MKDSNIFFWINAPTEDISSSFYQVLCPNMFIFQVTVWMQITIEHVKARKMDENIQWP